MDVQRIEDKDIEAKVIRAGNQIVLLEKEDAIAVRAEVEAGGDKIRYLRVVRNCAGIINRSGGTLRP